MCNHVYTGNHSHGPRSMGSRCPYPEFYAQIQRDGASAADFRPGPELPLDSSGRCIFHSQDLSWKRENDFRNRFLHLIRMLNADKTVRHCDLREFVFAGMEVETKGRPGGYALLIKDVTFQKHAYFTGASFPDSFELDGADFQDGATFKQTAFAHGLTVHNTRFRGLDFANARLMGPAFFSGVKFLSFCLFAGVEFSGVSDSFGAKFEDALFEGITDFSSSIFTTPVGFRKVRFEDVADFRTTQFHDQAEFSDVCFMGATEFIDASFYTTTSSARLRGSAVEFNRIEVAKDALLAFVSTDPLKKLFNHDVQFTFSKDPAGILRFENVNFSQIGAASRERLTGLAKLGRVEIGPGCIKYRFQTAVRTISVCEGAAGLALELCQTFVNYFTASSGVNLGFEVVERDQTNVSFFYFTDEDISEDVFVSRLAQTEWSLWNLLLAQSDEQLVALAGGAGQGPSARKERAIINAIDGLSALFGTFIRVGARIALGEWRERDTKALLGVIRFNEAGAEDRARSLHSVLAARYTGEALLDINRRQNGLLAPMLRGTGRSLPPAKIRILFLGANSSVTPLALEQEVMRIQTSLKLAKERENLQLSQEFAVTAQSVMQAILEASPTIVHFSGHGTGAGLILHDELGKSKVAPAEALSSLFALFRDTVRCVVLNSCYSEYQARAIRRHIPHVIGMTGTLGDPGALAFSSGFYKAIGDGRDIPFAFELGKAAMELEGCSGEDAPVLL